MQKYLDIAIQVCALLGLLSVILGMLANVLPDGRLKLAASYLGIRVGKAWLALSGVLTPKLPTHPKE